MISSGTRGNMCTAVGSGVRRAQLAFLTAGAGAHGGPSPSVLLPVLTFYRTGGAPGNSRKARQQWLTHSLAVCCFSPGMAVGGEDRVEGRLLQIRGKLVTRERQRLSQPSHKLWKMKSCLKVFLHLARSPSQERLASRLQELGFQKSTRPD